MKRQLFLTVVLSLMCFLACPGDLGASSGESIGKPTGKLRNRYFTHPQAKDVYIDDDKPLKEEKEGFYSPPIEEGKIWISTDEEKEAESIRGQIKKPGEDDGVLIGRESKKDKEDKKDKDEETKDETAGDK